MSKLEGAIEGTIIAAAVVVTVLIFEKVVPYEPPDLDMSGSVVKLITTGGHGSGVHIGNGYVITAAHVAVEGVTMTWLSDTDDRGSTSLVWRNVQYDVALMKITNWENISAANLECRIPDIGETITMKGNPLSLEHITMWGRVAGKMTNKGPWAEVVPIDGSIVGGMSGGGVFDENGDMVGINVGGMIQQVGFGGGPAGIGLIVPGWSICSIMAKM